MDNLYSLPSATRSSIHTLSPPFTRDPLARTSGVSFLPLIVDWDSESSPTRWDYGPSVPRFLFRVRALSSGTRSSTTTQGVVSLIFTAPWVSKVPVNHTKMLPVLVHTTCLNRVGRDLLDPVYLSIVRLPVTYLRSLFLFPSLPAPLSVLSVSLTPGLSGETPL